MSGPLPLIKTDGVDRILAYSAGRVWAEGLAAGEESELGFEACLSLSFTPEEGAYGFNS